jgi:hypothetical protein
LIGASGEPFRVLNGIMRNDNLQIRNCTFKYECPLDWNKLQETNDPLVRFCDVCSQNVYFVKTRAALSAAIQNNRCVCVPYDILDTQDFIHPKYEPKRVIDPDSPDKHYKVLMGAIAEAVDDSERQGPYEIPSFLRKQKE